jgi:hypothetical protein
VKPKGISAYEYSPQLNFKNVFSANY